MENTNCIRDKANSLQFNLLMEKYFAIKYNFHYDNKVQLLIACLSVYRVCVYFLLVRFTCEIFENLDLIKVRKLFSMLLFIFSKVVTYS